MFPSAVAFVVRRSDRLDGPDSICLPLAGSLASIWWSFRLAHTTFQSSALWCVLLPLSPCCSFFPSPERACPLLAVFFAKKSGACAVQLRPAYEHCHTHSLWPRIGSSFKIARQLACWRRTGHIRTLATRRRFHFENLILCNFFLRLPLFRSVWVPVSVCVCVCVRWLCLCRLRSIADQHPTFSCLFTFRKCFCVLYVLAVTHLVLIIVSLWKNIFFRRRVLSRSTNRIYLFSPLPPLFFFDRISISLHPNGKRKLVFFCCDLYSCGHTHTHTPLMTASSMAWSPQEVHVFWTPITWLDSFDDICIKIYFRPFPVMFFLPIFWTFHRLKSLKKTISPATTHWFESLKESLIAF